MLSGVKDPVLLKYFVVSWREVSQLHVLCAETVAGEDPEFVRAKFFFRDEFLVSVDILLSCCM